MLKNVEVAFLDRMMQDCAAGVVLLESRSFLLQQEFDDLSVSTPASIDQRRTALR